MTAQPITTCPDCQAEMQAIRLFDRAGEGAAHLPLSYAAGDAKQSWFFGRFEIAGTITARMCPVCGRIILHGQPDPWNKTVPTKDAASNRDLAPPGIPPPLPAISYATPAAPRSSDAWPAVFIAVLAAILVFGGMAAWMVWLDSGPATVTKPPATGVVSSPVPSKHEGIGER
jgi:hypothetical protein